MLLTALVAWPSTPRAAESVARFAIFPSSSIVPCWEDVRWAYVDPVQRLMNGRPDAELTFSFYARGTDRTVLPPIGDLWTSNPARRRPALDTVRATAQRLKVDAVIMNWLRCSQTWNLPRHLYWVDVYVVDVTGDRLYHARTPLAGAGQTTAKLIDQFFAARPSTSRD